MSAALPQAEVDALTTALFQTRVVTYAHTAALSLVAYDILTNLGDEVTYIWQKSWSLPKALYFAARYYTLLDLTVLLSFDLAIGLTNECEVYLWLLGNSSLVVESLVINTILFLRLRALYEGNKAVLASTAIFMLAQWILELIFSIVVARTAQIVDKPPGIPWPGCLANGIDQKFTLIAWIPNILLASLCVALTLYRLWTATEIEWRGGNGFGRRVLSPLLATFYRDGTGFFVIIFVMVIATAATGFALKNTLATILVPWLALTYSFAGSKMILNLRIAAGQHPWTWTTSGTTSAAYGEWAVPSQPASTTIHFDARTGESMDGYELQSVEPGAWYTK